MFQVKLWNDPVPYMTEGADTPNTMDVYLVEAGEAVPCVVVLPGGGYSHRAAHEGAPIAEFFNSRGMNAVVVNYRVLPSIYPANLADAQRAIKLVRANAEKWKVNPKRIVTLGFSAGGHLSGACATLGDVTVSREGSDAIDALDGRPNGAVLCYACLSFSGQNDYGHFRCGVNFMGKERCKYESEYYSLENRVTESTPPCFFWHTSDDEVVNVKHTLTFAEKLRAYKIPFEIHIYPHGRHGLGLAKDAEDVSTWAPLCADWIERNI